MSRTPRRRGPLCDTQNRRVENARRTHGVFETSAWNGGSGRRVSLVQHLAVTAAYEIAATFGKALVQQRVDTD
ncbi:unnamed protein product [Lampetra fluviatilis]